jgi:hypothetical protein
LLATSWSRALQLDHPAGGVKRVMFRDLSWFVANVFLSWNSDPHGHRDDGVIGALVLLMVLIGVGLWIVDALRHTAALQDCVLQGRTNCLPSLR